MRLIEEMEQWLQSEDSMFRAQLLREDIDRLRRLESLARRYETLDAFAKEGLAIGWTRGDLRTHEVEEPLSALLAAVHAYERGGRTDASTGRCATPGTPSTTCAWPSSSAATDGLAG